jgi:hypothetical protein
VQSFSVGGYQRFAESYRLHPFVEQAPCIPEQRTAAAKENNHAQVMLSVITNYVEQNPS